MYCNSEDGHMTYDQPIDRLASFTTYHMTTNNKTLFLASSPPQNVYYSNVTSQSVLITWSTPKSVYGEIVQYNVSLIPSDGSTISRILLVDRTGPDLSATISGLESYTKYVIEVRAGTLATNSNLNILWSDPNARVTFVTDQTGK